MTFNQQYFDATLRHQIDLLRYGAGVARKVNSLLDETRADMRKQVERRLGKTSGLDSAGLRRLRELERAIDQTRSGAWNDVNEQWQRATLNVALEEPLFIEGALTSILPVELDLVQPSAGTLRALATTRPFQGRTLREWASGVQRADLTRIHQQIRIGMVQGEASRDIAKRVFGERGAMAITRSQAEAVTRTVINGVSNAAQQEFLADNADLFDVEQLVATLDSRTSPICRAQDGKQYPVGKGPIPPLHVNCRSIRVAVLDGEVVGERPFRAGTEKQMLREYAAQAGLDKAPVSRADLPRGHAKRFDTFARKRMRELTGQVPARTTYDEWLRRQSAELQNDILGPARAKLFRDGMTLDRFVARDGSELTLDELKARNRIAPEHRPQNGPTQAELARRAVERAEQEKLEAEARAAAVEERARKEAEQAALEAQRRVEEAERNARHERDRLAAEEKARLENANRQREEAMQAAQEAEKRAREEHKMRVEEERKRKDAEDSAKSERKRAERAEIEAHRAKLARLEAELRATRQASLEKDRRESEAKAAAQRQAEEERLAKAREAAHAAERRKLSPAQATAVEKIRALGIRNVHIVSDDFDLEEVHTLLKDQGADELFLRAGSLNDLSIGCVEGRGWVDGDHGPITEIGPNANGTFSDEVRNGASYIKLNKRAAAQTKGWERERSERIKYKQPEILPLGAAPKVESTLEPWKRTLIHEFGHAVHLHNGHNLPQIDALVKSRYDSADREGISRYGATNHCEYFAESYLAYRTRKSDMERDAPHAFAMVQEVLRLRRMPL